MIILILTTMTIMHVYELDGGRPMARSSHFVIPVICFNVRFFSSYLFVVGHLFSLLLLHVSDIHASPVRSLLRRHYNSF